MKTVNIGHNLPASAIALGCMRISGMSPKDTAALIQTSLDAGIDFFDHADIYGGGESEVVFARAMKDAGIGRDRLILQSKCGIRGGFFDFSKEHILSSAENILKRLQTDYLDILLLHRPDTLMEPEEVAEAFNILHTAGKVRYFGVSNQNSGQIKLLRKYVKQPLLVNQLQFSIAHTGIIDSGLNVNMKNPPSVDHDGDILTFCRLENMTIQAWSPFQHGFFSGPFIGNEQFTELNKQLAETAKAYNITVEAAAIAWILRHPAHIQPVIGTTNKERVRAIAAAADVNLTREEWYALYRAAGNQLP